MGESFAISFPVLLVYVRQLYNSFVIISTVILFAGLLMAVWRGMLGNLTEIMRGIVTIAVIAVVFNFFPQWVDELQRIVYKGVVEQLGANPAETHQRFAELVTEPVDQDTEVGVWDILFSDNGGLGKVLIFAAIYLLSKLAWFLMWLAFLVQHILLLLGIGVSPLFLSMFMLNATRGIAIRYILSLLGIILWPLGWAVADVITRSLLDLAAKGQIYLLTQNDVVLYGSQTVFFLFLLSLWVIFSTLAAPRLVARAITTGSQVGVALLGGFGGAVAGGATTGIGGAAVASAGGAGGLALAAGGAGGTAGFLSSSAGGSGALASAGIGALAVGAVSLSNQSSSASSSGGQSSADGGDGGGSSGPPPDYDTKAALIAAKQKS